MTSKLERAVVAERTATKGTIVIVNTRPIIHTLGHRVITTDRTVPLTLCPNEAPITETLVAPLVAIVRVGESTCTVLAGIV